MEFSLLLVSSAFAAPPIVLETPSIIGRGPDDVLFVATGVERRSLMVTDRRVSRAHLEIVEIARGLALRDISSNGTFVLTPSGEIPLSEAAELSRSVQRLRLGNIRLDIAPADPTNRPVSLHILTPSGQQRVVTLDDGDIGLSEADGRLFLDIAEDAPPDAPVVIRRGPDGPEIMVSADVEAKVRANRASVKPGARPLQHLDVIEIGGHAITVWFALGPSGLRCPNDDCQLLNPYDLEQNCTFCGAKLDAGQTFVVE